MKNSSATPKPTTLLATHLIGESRVASKVMVLNMAPEQSGKMLIESQLHTGLISQPRCGKS